MKRILDFNKEIICGECGSLLAAYASGFGAAHFTARPTLISAVVVGGTLVGGTLFWTTARVLNQRGNRGWSVKALAADIGYFTPATITLGFLVYDPVIFFVSRGLLERGHGVGLSVLVGQMCAFMLFLASMNLYRMVLARTVGRHL